MKIKTFILLFTLMMSLCACEIGDVEDVDKLIVDYNEDVALFTLNQSGELVLAVSPSEVSGSIVIPLKLTVDGEEKTVTALADGLFLNCTSMTSLHVNGMISEVQGGVLEGCTSLETLILDDGVESVGFNAAYGCENLNLIWSLSLDDYILVDVSNIYGLENISLRGRIKLCGWE